MKQEARERIADSGRCIRSQPSQNYLVEWRGVYIAIIRLLSDGEDILEGQVAHVVNVFLYRDGGNDPIPLVGLGSKGRFLVIPPFLAALTWTSRSLLDFSHPDVEVLEV